MRRLHLNAKTLIGAVLLSWAIASPSLAQEINCDEAIASSNQNFFNAEFEEATTTLKYCLSNEAFTEEEEAYTLLAQIYFSVEEYDLSTSAIMSLLDIAPEYELPERLPPPFVVFFERTRNIYIRHAMIAAKLRPAPEYTRKRGLRSIDSRWYWIGGGVLVAGTAAILLDDDSRPVTFAPPPGPPGGASSNE